MPSTAELWALLREQQAESRAQRIEIHVLKARDDRREAELERRRRDEPDLPARAPEMHERGKGTRRRVSRSGLLKAAAAGVAGVVGAEALTSATPAAAANGAPVILGAYNTATSTTVIDVGSSGSTALYGVSYSGPGLYGQSSSAAGVYGYSNSNTGVYGISRFSYGIAGYSSSTSDLAAVGTGRLLLTPQGTPGAPTSGTYTKGELIVDSTGVPYACTAGGTSSTWQAVGNLRSFGASTRVFGDGTVTPAGTTTDAIDATVAGVPAGATSAYCAVQATAAGVMTLFPDGSTDPGIANWANTGAADQLALFYMLVPLSSAGKFRLHSYLTGQIYVDVWGYLL